VANRIVPPRSNVATDLLPEGGPSRAPRDQHRSRGPDSEGLVWREQQESNLRPLASEAGRAASEGSHGSPPGAEPSGIAEHLEPTVSHVSHGIALPETGFATGLLPEAGALLTVREVASRLRVSTATVYKLVHAGRLGHVRVANAIRVPAAVLAYASQERR
jgi:excisionase family DNA binding protein